MLGVLQLVGACVPDSAKLFDDFVVARPAGGLRIGVAGRLGCQADFLLPIVELLVELLDVRVRQADDLALLVGFFLGRRPRDIGRLFVLGRLQGRVGLLEGLLVVKVGGHSQHDVEHDGNDERDLQTLRCTGHGIVLLSETEIASSGRSSRAAFRQVPTETMALSHRGESHHPF